MPDSTGIQFVAGQGGNLEKPIDEHPLDEVLAFYQSLPDYAPTPLIALDRLATHLGLERIWVKDEGRRFGLKAFKAMGATYGLCRALAARLDIEARPLTLAALANPSLAPRLAQITCITATDGNHGRAVAWAAHRIGCRAVVYMPRGTAQARIDNVRMFGATVEIIDGNYDQAVALAAEAAQKHDWLLIQDTIGEGCEQVARWIMDGYRILVRECLDALDGVAPTHVVLQAGVGSFAGAIQAELMARLGGRRPHTTIVEPARAACFYQSALAGDGRTRQAEGDLKTIMAGLACGVPNPLAREILWPSADLFTACADRVTRRGMRVLGNPLEGDPAVISGESGAVGLGLVYEAMTDRRLAGLKRAMGLAPSSRVLVFSTEADTDPVMYRQVVWGGR
jgi:diaminopropionate ammonia-lyase